MVLPGKLHNFSDSESLVLVTLSYPGRINSLKRRVVALKQSFHPYDFHVVFLIKEWENLVHFDHILDVIGHG